MYHLMTSFDSSNENFDDAFRELLGQRPALSWQDFTELALFHPKVGYYAANRKRIGHGPNTDFYTSSSLGHVFARLVVGSLATLLGGRSLQRYTLVEIGAEPGSDLFERCRNRFAEIRTVRLGETFAPSGPTIVFANELFDAQPFHRLRFDPDRGWQTCGVTIADNALMETTLDETPKELVPLIPHLPQHTYAGYRIDISLRAEHLLQEVLSHKAVEAFLFFDYGVSWHELTEDLPQGSARAYFRHRQSNDLLGNPGQQDLTCHVCWDRLAAVASAAGFREPRCQRQEAFFIHHAATDIANIIRSTSGHLAPERRTLQEILHPSYFGHRFQAFYSTRG